MNAQEAKQAHDREQLRNRLHQDYPSVLNAIPPPPCLPATVTQRMQGGIGELHDLKSKLNEILDRIQGPIPVAAGPVPPDEPGLQGEVDRFRRLSAHLNGLADEILLHL